MTTVDIVLGVVLIVASLFLIVAVLMQHGKAHNLSGTIAGGAETFFGKTKGQSIDKKLSTVTTVIAVIFVVIVLVVYLKQDATDTSGLNSSFDGNAVTTTVATTGDETEPEETGTGTAAATEEGTEASTAASTTAAAE